MKRLSYIVIIAFLHVLPMHLKAQSLYEDGYYGSILRIPRTAFSSSSIFHECLDKLNIHDYTWEPKYAYDKKLKSYVAYRYPNGLLKSNVQKMVAILRVESFVLTDKYLYMSIKIGFVDPLKAIDINDSTSKAFWVAGKMDYSETDPQKNKLKFTKILDTASVPIINLNPYIKHKEKILFTPLILIDTLIQKYGGSMNKNSLKLSYIIIDIPNNTRLKTFWDVLQVDYIFNGKRGSLFYNYTDKYCHYSEKEYIEKQNVALREFRYNAKIDKKRKKQP